MNDITNLTVLTPGQPAGTVAPPNVMAPGTVFANPSTQWDTPINMTFGDLTLELGLFTAVDQGLVPASGGGTQNFLRADGSWAPAGLGNITGPALMGSINATPGPPVPLTSAQFTSMIGLFTPVSSGAVPASGGGTANYLRADGTWSVPDADGPLPAGTVWGNPMLSPGPGMAMTPAMVTPLLSLFTQTTPGIVPPSGAGVNYFLRGDGTWALPPESAPIPPYTILGNFGPAAAVPGPVTTTQLTSMIDLFTATHSGTVPASGGGINNFLRADGVWTSPPGLAPISGPAVLGVTTTTPGVPHALSQAQLTAMLHLFTATTAGIVPASGGGRERFLRADGVWADVPEFPLPLGHEDWPLVGRGTLPSTYRQLTAEGIRNDAVTNEKLADMPAATIKGNLGPAIGVHDLSGAEVTSMLRRFTTTLQGVVPPSTNLGYFLRGDGTWQDIDIVGLHPIPNDTFLGNISGGTAAPVAIPFSQFMTHLSVFTHTANGLVPAPGTGPERYLSSDGDWEEIDQVPEPPAGTASNAALQADMTWQVPGTNYQSITASYTAIGTEDLISIIANLPMTLTLPLLSSVPQGKKIMCRVIIAAGSSLFIATQGTDALAVLSGASGWGNADPGGINLIGPATGQLLLFSGSASSWNMLNQGLPIRTPNWFMPGTIAPPAGTASNAALQADMTWKVPGTVFRNVSADYTILAADDLIYGQIPAGVTRTFTLPPSDSVPSGKRYTFSLKLSATAGFRIVTGGPGGSYVGIYASSGPLVLGTNQAIFAAPGTGNDIIITNTSGGVTDYLFVVQQVTGAWQISNHSIATNGTVTGGGSVSIPGLLIGPPAGTASNAALQADMTWKVPGTNTLITSADYTALATDDLIVYTSVAVNRTLTLPNPALVPDGKRLRIFASNFGTGTELRITSINAVIASPLFGGAGWMYLTEMAVRGPPTGFGNAIIELIKFTSTPDRWVFINGGPPIYATDQSGFDRYIPGSMPGPPAGTPATAVLHADMTWY